MPVRRSQKQIAEKYKGNLGYFKKPHYFRSLRAYIILAVLICVAAGVFYHFVAGTDEFYSPGPLSQQHQHLRENCEACHDQNQLADLVIKPGALQRVLEEAHSPKLAENIANTTRTTLRGIAYSKIDLACLQCHEGHDIHQPDKATIALSHFKSEIVIAHASACSTCHREHAGPAAMKLPSTADCLTCHADPERMAAASTRVQLQPMDRMPNRTGIVKTLDDGVAHFITPPTAAELAHKTAPAIFTSFSVGHPEFSYERKGLRDPDTLKFNHQRHLQSDIPKVNGKKLDCNYCHKPASDGVFYSRVSYEKNCKACHSLQFDPQNPELEIPHGDPDGVRAFLRTLPFQYANIAAKRGIHGQKEVAAFTNQQLLALRERVRSGEDFEKQIFFTADPYKALAPALATVAPMEHRALFPGCAYCHEVKPGPNGSASITHPVFVDRWLEHGRFTHLKHTQIACIECHNVSQSRETADILLPTKASCAECHRSQEVLAGNSLKEPVHHAAGLSIAAQERRDGMAPSDCTACHTFHAPTRSNGDPETESRLKKLLLQAEPAARSPLKRNQT